MTFMRKFVCNIYLRKLELLQLVAANLCLVSYILQLKTHILLYELHLAI